MKKKRTFGTFGVAVFLAASLLVAGCDATMPVTPQAVISKMPAPASVSVTLDIRFHSDWTPQRRDKAHAAARLLETVINSNAFARQLAARHDLQRSENLSGAEILQIIRSGHTLATLRNAGANHKPAVLPLSVAPDTREYAHHEGFTDLDTGIIYARRDWLDNQSACRLAGLFAHEYMHVIGFTHTTFNHPWLRLSVPYAVGEMVVELAETHPEVHCAAPKK